MLIPYNTDAPIYHWPAATVGLIVANVLVGLISLSLTEDAFAFLMLQYQHFRPWQWLTSLFMHDGLMHLFMNMINLWTFGLVVEGKLGPARFLAVFLGIGVAECIPEHLVGFILGANASLGASSAIYGLIAISMVWAPRNIISCMWIGGFHSSGTFDMPVLTLGMMLMSLQLFTGLLGATMASHPADMITAEFLHLGGAAIGAAVAFALLLTKQVDCEGWDVLSVTRGDHLNYHENKANSNFEENVKHNSDGALEDIRRFLSQDQPGMARQAHIEARQFIPGWVLPEADMSALIDSLLKRMLWNEAVEMMAEYLRTYRDRAVTVRIYLAKVCLERLGRPMQALKVLAKLDMKQVPAAALADVEKIKATALRRAEEDPYEVVNEEW